MVRYYFSSRNCGLLPAAKNRHILKPAASPGENTALADLDGRTIAL